MFVTAKLIFAAAKLLPVLTAANSKIVAVKCSIFVAANVCMSLQSCCFAAAKLFPVSTASNSKIVTAKWCSIFVAANVHFSATMFCS